MGHKSVSELRELLVFSVSLIETPPPLSRALTPSAKASQPEPLQQEARPALGFSKKGIGSWAGIGGESINRQGRALKTHMAGSVMCKNKAASEVVPVGSVSVQK